MGTRNSLDDMKIFLRNTGIACMIPCCMMHAFFEPYRAQQLYQSGKHEEAKAIFASLIAHDTTDWRSLYNLGSIELQDAQFDQAVAHFNKVLELQPDNALARERLNEALKKQEEKRERQKKEEEQEKDKQQKPGQEQDDKQQKEQQGQSDSSQDASAKQEQEPEQGQKSPDRTPQEQDKKESNATTPTQTPDQDQRNEQRAASLNTASEDKLTAEQKQLIDTAEKMDQAAQRYMIQHAQQQEEGVSHDAPGW